MWRRQGVVDPVRGVLLAGLLYFIHAFSTQSSRWIFFSTESLWKLLCATGLSTKPHTCVVVHYLWYPGIWTASTKWQILKTRPGKSEDESNSKHQEATFSLIVASWLVVKTFKNSTAERVQPAPIYLRYIRIPFQINCRASAARSDIPAIYFFGFTKLSVAMLVVQRLIVELWLVIILRFELNKRRRK